MRIRTVVIITGAAVAVLAAGAFAFVKTGAPAGAARAAQGLPQAEPQRDRPATPPSGGSRAAPSAAPSGSPSETPEKPKPSPTPEHDDEPDNVAARIAPPEPEKTERSKPDDSGGSNDSGGSPESGGSGSKVLGSGSCKASYYWQGQMTASGESFDPSELTAAHKTLPFDSKVRVTNKNNGKSVVVRINDRGPFTSGRCLDLSKAAMKDVDGTSSGVIPVRYEVLSRG